jgi:hypothetical protein
MFYQADSASEEKYGALLSREGSSPGAGLWPRRLAEQTARVRTARQRPARQTAGTRQEFPSTAWLRLVEKCLDVIGIDLAGAMLLADDQM